MNEKDPNGIEAHASGAKLDHGKLRAGLVLQGFKRALIGVSKVGTFGASKYSDNGWKSVANGFSRYQDAMYRHLLVEGVDEQSGLPHLYHAAWNLLAMIELKELSPAQEAPLKHASVISPAFTEAEIATLIEKQRRMPIKALDDTLCKSQFLYEDVDLSTVRCQPYPNKNVGEPLEQIEMPFMSDKQDGVDDSAFRGLPYHKC